MPCLLETNHHLQRYILASPLCTETGRTCTAWRKNAALGVRPLPTETSAMAGTVHAPPPLAAMYLLSSMGVVGVRSWQQPTVQVVKTRADKRTPTVHVLLCPPLCVGALWPMPA